MEPEGLTLSDNLEEKEPNDAEGVFVVRNDELGGGDAEMSLLRDSSGVLLGELMRDALLESDAATL